MDERKVFIHYLNLKMILHSKFMDYLCDYEFVVINSKIFKPFCDLVMFERNFFIFILDSIFGVGLWLGSFVLMMF